MQGKSNKMEDLVARLGVLENMLNVMFARQARYKTEHDNDVEFLAGEVATLKTVTRKLTLKGSYVPPKDSCERESCPAKTDSANCH